jgi:hypothetical protein
MTITNGMKWGILLIFLLWSGVGFAQNSDSSFFCRARWKKGDTQSFRIHHRTRSEIPGQGPVTTDLFYQATVTVLDSNATGYTMQWVFNLSDSLRRRRPYLVDSLPVYSGLKMVYTTDVMGSFLFLRNWEEVRMAYVQMMEIALPRNASDAERDLLSRTEAQYRTREAVEADLIKEIKLFHQPFGHRYSRQQRTMSGDLPNPWMSDRPLPGLVTTELTAPVAAGGVGAEAEADRFLLRLGRVSDSVKMMALVEGFIQRTGAAKDSVLARMKDDVSRFRLQEMFRFYGRVTTGWPEGFSFEKSVRTRDRVDEERYVLQTVQKQHDR